MVAPKTVVAPIHLFEPVDEPRRCQRVGPQPTTREGKGTDIHRGDTGHRRHPDQRTPPGKRGPIQPIRCAIGAVAGLSVRLVPIVGLIAALHSQPFPSTSRNRYRRRSGSLITGDRLALPDDGPPDLRKKASFDYNSVVGENESLSASALDGAQGARDRHIGGLPGLYVIRSEPEQFVDGPIRMAESSPRSGDALSRYRIAIAGQRHVSHTATSVEPPSADCKPVGESPPGSNRGPASQVSAKVVTAGIGCVRAQHFRCIGSSVLGTTRVPVDPG